MQDWYEFSKRVIAAASDASYWSHFEVPFPKSNESWAFVALVVSVAVSLCLVLVLSRPFKGRKLKIRFRDSILAGYRDDVAQSNIVQIKLETAIAQFPRMFVRARSGDTSTVVLVVKSPSGVRSFPCRLSLNQKYEDNTVLIHRDLAKKLGLAADATDDSEYEVDFHWPYWRLDKYTFNSPDPEVKLQYRIGAIFLVLGIIIPKILDWSWTYWAVRP